MIRMEKAEIGRSGKDGEMSVIRGADMEEPAAGLQIETVFGGRSAVSSATK